MKNLTLREVHTLLQENQLKAEKKVAAAAPPTVRLYAQSMADKKIRSTSITTPPLPLL